MAQARWTRPVVALTAIAVCVLALPGVAEAGWFAYTANRGANTISQYSIASDGSLSSLRGRDEQWRTPARGTSW